MNRPLRRQRPGAPTARRPQRGAGRRLALVVVPLLLATSACAATVAGSPSAGTIAPAVEDAVRYDQVALKETFVETPQEVADYWQERDPSDVGSQHFGPSDTVGPRDEATGFVMPPTYRTAPLPEADSGLGEVAQAQDFPLTGLAGKTAGQLFFSVGEDSYICSATVVNSETRDLVVTAAHCLWDTEGDLGVASNVKFVPATSDLTGTGPYGIWYGTEAWIPEEFKTSARSGDVGTVGEGWSYDFAFLRVAPNEAGQKIQEVTGGQGLGFGIPAGSLVAVGYPGEPPYDGTREVFCSSSRWEPSPRSGYRMACTLTGGASGGGWLARYDDATGEGYVVATSSTAKREHGQYAEWVEAMALGQVALDLFTAAGGTP